MARSVPVVKGAFVRIARLVALFVIVVGLLLALVPVPSSQRDAVKSVWCVPVLDGWSGEPARLNAAEFQNWMDSATQRTTADPAVEAKIDRLIAWRNESGVCGSFTHDRLVWSAWLLGAAALGVGGFVAIRRRQRQGCPLPRSSELEQPAGSLR